MMRAVVYNNDGDHDPSGKMFALAKNRDHLEQIKLDFETKRAAKLLKVDDLVRPLVLRANKGDQVIIELENLIQGRHVGIHLGGGGYDIASDGTSVGRNPPSLVAYKETREYVWNCKEEGAFLFHDGGDLGGTKDGTISHGLWGALIVEPAGATWTDPVTGAEMEDGLYADVHPARPPSKTKVPFGSVPPKYPPSTASFREYVVFLQDEIDAYAGNTDPMPDPCAADGMAHPKKPDADAAGTPEAPVAELMTLSYRSEPLMNRLRKLYKRYNEGCFKDCLRPAHDEEGIQRIYDTLQDGTSKYPDGTQIKSLKPLPDREPPPHPTPMKPGFPNFIDGIVGQKSPVPPWPTSKLGPVPEGFTYRVATPIEEAAMNPHPQPGCFFPKLPMDQAVEVVKHNLSVVERSMKLNKYGWFNPRGTFYVLDSEMPTGDPTLPTDYQPFFIRATQDQIVEWTLSNRLPAKSIGNAQDERLPRCDAIGYQGEASMHVHLVKFDALASDGSSTGWNYISAPIVGQKFYYRWWADEEFGQIFFHDHLFANTRQKSGLYGDLLIQAKGSTFHHPVTDEPILTGLEAVIKTPTESYREFCFYIGDFMPAFNQTLAKPLNAPTVPGGMNDPGVMVLNYHLEPLVRRKGDASMAFSSKAHQEPSTHIFQAYPGDKIRIRLVQGSHEEAHTFMIYGMRWRRFWRNQKSYLANQHTLGISETFNFHIDHEYGPGEYMYKLAGLDDQWVGAWGIIRVHPTLQPTLALLPSNPHPFQKTSHPPPNPAKTREYRITAERRYIAYNQDQSDPYGLVYRIDAYKFPGSTDWTPVSTFGMRPEPAIIRVRRGEWLKIHLENRLGGPIEKEPHYPTTPLDDFNRFVSTHVSIHVDLIAYDVRTSMGVNLGASPVNQTVRPGEWVTYTYYAGDEFLGAVPMHDHADLRNHKHHGLVGAVVVLEEDAEPNRWFGASATVKTPAKTYDESVLVVQDGLRLYDNGNPNRYAREYLEDSEDLGQRAFNYHAAPIIRKTGEMYAHYDDKDALILYGTQGRLHRLHAVGTGEKPRNAAIVVHGHQWKKWRFLDDSEMVNCEDGFTVGSVRTMEFVTEE
ncbi:hypothetical protein HK104_006708, partial [Borealophlyctis nickersoniae]